MKKILGLLLILFFISGCLGSLQNLRKEKTPEVAYKRGIDIIFKTNENQPPLQISLNDDFYVSLDVINYAKHELNANILVYDNWGEGYGNVEAQDSTTLEAEAGSIGKKKTISIGPFRYTNKLLVNKKTNIIAEAEILNYPVDIESNLRIKKSGSTMTSNSLFSGNTLGREAANAPITIDNIKITQVNLPDSNQVNLKLTIYFRNYGGQINNDERKIENFDINLIGGTSFECKPYKQGDKFLVFKDKKDVTIICSTSVDLGDQEYKDYPLKISFNYPYKISKSVEVKII
jgi:hypothetical protein